MNTVLTTSTTGTHIMDTSKGILIRKVGGSYYVAYHFGGGETMTYGRYATEGGARRSALALAKVSNEKIATA